MWVSTAQAASIFNKTPATIRRWCADSGRIPKAFKKRSIGKREYEIWVEDEIVCDPPPATLNTDALAELSQTVRVMVTEVIPQITSLQNELKIIKKILITMNQEK